MDFKNLIDQIKLRNKESLNSSSTEEAINKVSQDEKELDALTDEYQKLKDENARLKDRIIDGLKSGSSTQQPRDDTAGTSKTLEECIQEVVSNRK